MNLHCILEPSDDPSLHHASKVTQIQMLIEEINIEKIIKFLLIRVILYIFDIYLSNKRAIKIS